MKVSILAQALLGATAVTAQSTVSSATATATGLSAPTSSANASAIPTVNTDEAVTGVLNATAWSLIVCKHCCADGLR